MPIRSQDGGVHEAVEDARASMNLVLYAIKHGLPAPLVQPKVDIWGIGDEGVEGIKRVGYIGDVRGVRVLGGVGDGG